MPIYTKTGDAGETSLYGGKRVLKNHAMVDLYGMIDEGNSHIGLIISLLPTQDSTPFLKEIQKDFHSISAFFAGSPIDLLILTIRVQEMERRIDRMDFTLSPLHQFILPGGTVSASYIHIARSVIRNIERKVVFVAQNYKKQDEFLKATQSVVQYFNRLSDYLFVLARLVNKDEGGVETVWDGGKKQQ